MKCRRTPKRIKRFLTQLGLRAAVTAALTDPRKARGRRWSFGTLVDVLLTGALLQCPSLAAVERASDTLERLDPRPLRAVLRQQVRDLLRRKTLQPHGLPFGVLTIDGKTLWTGDYAADPACQAQDGVWNLRVMRAVLTSAPSRPCIDQDIIPAATNEMGHFEAFWRSLRRAYGRTDLFRLVTLDAGYSSKHTARLIDGDGVGYVLRIKGEQPTLSAELQRLLTPCAGRPEAVSRWESHRGKHVQRRVVRTATIADFDGWAHLRQGWLVQTVVRHADGHDEIVFERWFITNLPWNTLTAAQILDVVRRHWAIENDCNWVLDVVWREDTTAWARNAQHVAGHRPLRTLSWLRMLAYNVLTWLMRVRLRRRLTWSALREILTRLLAPLPTAAEIEVAFATLG
jgi:predicted transposase YbfD/YdcC